MPRIPKDDNGHLIWTIHCDCSSSNCSVNLIHFDEDRFSYLEFSNNFYLRRFRDRIKHAFNLLIHGHPLYMDCVLLDEKSQIEDLQEALETVKATMFPPTIEE